MCVKCVEPVQATSTAARATARRMRGLVAAAPEPHMHNAQRTTSNQDNINTTELSQLLWPGRQRHTPLWRGRTTLRAHSRDPSLARA